MARIIISEGIDRGDGYSSRTTYDSNWCMHKTDKDYCKICNNIKTDEIKLNKKQLSKKLRLKKGWKIKNINVVHDKNGGVIIYIEKHGRKNIIMYNKELHDK